jgi:hypothetical protein
MRDFREDSWPCLINALKGGFKKNSHGVDHIIAQAKP